MEVIEDEEKVEVDLQLFIKCRLCLEEVGQYQIVPTIRKQFKLCFDIDVEPYDGLPQLVCTKCSSLLKQFSEAKLIFTEKQKDLKSRLRPNIKPSDTVQQQDTVSSTQTEPDTVKKKVDDASSCHRIQKNINKDNERILSEKADDKSVRKLLIKIPSVRHSSTETLASSIPLSTNTKPDGSERKSKKSWQRMYIKQFVCRYCSKYFKDKKCIKAHIKKNCTLFTQCLAIEKKFCLVNFNKIDSKENLTGSRHNVVFNQKKVIQSKKANYYILYSLKSGKQCDSSDSSDFELTFNRQKRKRVRQISKSSDDTIVIDQNKSCHSEPLSKRIVTEETKITNIVSEIECVSIEDSDTASTHSLKVRDNESEIPNKQKANNTYDKIINNIITMCSVKYTKKLNEQNCESSRRKEDTVLKHKILSIGRKVIPSTGINTTGLLRYMEHKNLELIWVPKIEGKVNIKSRSKEPTDNGNSNLGWENIESIHHYNNITEDFIKIFYRASLQEATQIQINAKIGLKAKSTEKDNIFKNKGQASEGLHMDNRTLTLEGPVTDQMINNTTQTNNPTQNVSLIQTNTHSELLNLNESSLLRHALDSEKNLKILNANPVANPKQLPRKANFFDPATLIKLYPEESNDTEKAAVNDKSDNTRKSNEVLNMPIITSTVSLASVDVAIVNKNANENSNKQAAEGGYKLFIDSNIQRAESSVDAPATIKRVTESSRPQGTLPKIKVKPASELMSQRALSQQNNSFAVNTSWNTNNSQNKNVLQSTESNTVYTTGAPPTGFKNVTQPIIFLTQVQNKGANMCNSAVSTSSKPIQSLECVKLHTVELPNTRTESPFRYFQNLLHLHNLHLLDSVDPVPNTMFCLTKFKVLFEQEKHVVQLCLLLFCEDNIFCIKANDPNQKELDISKFSANWQWEVLRVFKGDDVLPKIAMTAMQFSPSVHTNTNCFLYLLKSIVYSKD